MVAISAEDIQSGKVDLPQLRFAQHLVFTSATPSSGHNSTWYCVTDECVLYRVNIHANNIELQTICSLDFMPAHLVDLASGTEWFLFLALGDMCDGAVFAVQNNQVSQLMCIPNRSGLCDAAFMPFWHKQEALIFSAGCKSGGALSAFERGYLATTFAKVDIGPRWAFRYSIGITNTSCQRIWAINLSSKTASDGAETALIVLSFPWATQIYTYSSVSDALLDVSDESVLSAGHTLDISTWEDFIARATALGISIVSRDWKTEMSYWKVNEHCRINEATVLNSTILISIATPNGRFLQLLQLTRSADSVDVKEIGAAIPLRSEVCMMKILSAPRNSTSFALVAMHDNSLSMYNIGMIGLEFVPGLEGAHFCRFLLSFRHFA